VNSESRIQNETRGLTCRILNSEFWIPNSRFSNSAKHGLNFADAEQVLNGPCVTFVDDRFDYGEERFITLGLLAGRVIVIAHASRGDDITRIISMRKANRREQKIYQKRLAES
jgi:uncharacterized DUF497 family protein